jgi:hypothetical protein
MFLNSSCSLTGVCSEHVGTKLIISKVAVCCFSPLCSGLFNFLAKLGRSLYNNHWVYWKNAIKTFKNQLFTTFWIMNYYSATLETLSLDSNRSEKWDNLKPIFIIIKLYFVRNTIGNCIGNCHILKSEWRNYIINMPKNLQYLKFNDYMWKMP